MQKITSLVFTSLLLSGTAFASSVNPSLSSQPANMFATIGLGYSWSNNANISVDHTFWDESPQGYEATLGRTFMVNGAMGYIFNPLLSAGVELAYRGDYQFSKYQTSAASSTPGFLGEKTRYFNLSNTAALANIYVNKFGPSHYLEYHLTPTTSIFPFVGAGIGVASNTVSNFHSVTATSPSASAMINKTSSDWAYQVMAGVGLALNKTFSVDTGYRYFYGGKFKSDENIINTPLAGSFPWTGKLTAHEVFIELNAAF